LRGDGERVRQGEEDPEKKSKGSRSREYLVKGVIAPGGRARRTLERDGVPVFITSSRRAPGRTVEDMERIKRRKEDPPRRAIPLQAGEAALAGTSCYNHERERTNWGEGKPAGRGLG